MSNAVVQDQLHGADTAYLTLMSDEYRRIADT